MAVKRWNGSKWIVYAGADTSSLRGTTSNRPISPVVGDQYYDTTLDCLFVYTANHGWLQTVLASVPGTPTIGTATAIDQTSISVAFTAPTFNGNLVISQYTVTSSPGNITATGQSSPITVTGLNPGTSYTFTVFATNALGNSSNSSSSTAVSTLDYTHTSGGNYIGTGADGVGSF